MIAHPFRWCEHKLMEASDLRDYSKAWPSTIRNLCAGDVPVIVVGGGAGLCGDAIEGASMVLKPPHAAVANAVGAAIPQVPVLGHY